jgi:hypothetical protein
MVEEGVIGLEHQALVPVTVLRNVTVYVPRVREVAETVQLAGGKTQVVKRLVTEMVPETRQEAQTTLRADGKTHTVRVPVKSCKFFAVSKEGKLEALDAARATAALKKRTAVLTGESTEVDQRHLVLIKPGTLYLVVPPPPPQVLPAPAPPEGKKGT